MQRLFSLALMSALSLVAQSHQLDLTIGYNYQDSDQGHLEFRGERRLDLGT
jgi:hypothetical protein